MRTVPAGGRTQRPFISRLVALRCRPCGKRLPADEGSQSASCVPRIIAEMAQSPDAGPPSAEARLDERRAKLGCVPPFDRTLATGRAFGGYQFKHTRKRD